MAQHMAQGLLLGCALAASAGPAWAEPPQSSSASGWAASRHRRRHRYRTQHLGRRGRFARRDRYRRLLTVTSIVTVVASVVAAIVVLISAVVLSGVAALGHPAQVVDDPERRLRASLGGVPDGAAEVERDPADADAEPRSLDQARVTVRARHVPCSISCGIPGRCPAAGCWAAAGGGGAASAVAGAGATCWAAAGVARSARQDAGKRKVARIGFSRSGRGGGCWLVPGPKGLDRWRG